MTEFPSLAAPNRLDVLLEKIVARGEPEKVDGAWLKSVGMKNSNDRSLPKVLEILGFVDSSRVPTQKWTDYRVTKNSRAVLAAAVREGYAPLYRDQPNAHQSSDDDLRDFFRVKSNSDNSKATRMVRTFKKLCALSDLDQIQDAEITPEEHKADTPKSNSAKQVQEPNQTFTQKLHINVQVHISPDSTPEQIDKIFESMAKHLSGRATDT
ncbi:MAG: DUF5343 domain-containing protein [Anaerolineaceae bacterium]|nr:DUF5343 domain-containing protein [Anaerolineaceae bacterium]